MTCIKKSEYEHFLLVISQVEVNTDLCNTARLVLDSQSRDRVKLAFEGRWLTYTGQLTIKINIRDFKVLAFIGMWIV